jgi:hypothetical protein
VRCGSMLSLLWTDSLEERVAYVFRVEEMTRARKVLDGN